MVPGMLALLTITAGLNTPANGPDRLNQRYRLDVVIQQEVDLTAVGQGPQTSEVNATVYVNLTMSDTTGGKLAHAVIDSMLVTATGQLGGLFTQDLADSLRGQWIHAYIVDGKLSGTPKPSVEGNAAMGMAVPVINALFPGITSKAATAENWADTTNNDVTSEAGTQSSQQIVNWSVTSREGGNLKLAGTGTGSLTAEQGGQQISGTVSSTSSVTSPIGGPATEAKITSTQELSVLNPALPEPIPVRVTTIATLTMLP